MTGVSVMFVPGKQFVNILSEGEDDNPRGTEKAREKQELKQQDAAMGELVHAPILTQPRPGTSITG